ncbi:PTS sugar transporter subunit IIA [candidate division WOR-3 bacterium]|nr:PTS sugar transporter subunit IIA [candidate division WOR-3 bacterium]
MVKISELLPRSAILLRLSSREKFEVIRELVKPLLETGAVVSEEELISAILRRENMESTGIGQGVAIPHARTTSVERTVLAFARSDEGVDFSSLDGRPSHVIFLIAAPEAQKAEYIVTLARLSRLLRREEVRVGLGRAASPDEVIEIIRQYE